MTGPEHYREAERLLSNAEREIQAATTAGGGERLTIALEVAAGAAAIAQAHATLALAAATAADQATAYDGDEGHSRSRGWAGVA